MPIPPDVPKPATKVLKESVAGTRSTPPTPTLPKPDGLGTVKRDELAGAVGVATAAGMQVARNFSKLDRRQRLTVVSAFRRQLLSPGRPGRRRSEEITAAYADWKAGVRGVELYQKHIPGLARMSYWKRKVKTRALLEAIRSRDRRESKGRRESLVQSER